VELVDWFDNNVCDTASRNSSRDWRLCDTSACWIWSLESC